jgi:vacuolar-type H+-ATPase catalytic subunit A/Vma1
MMKVIMNFHQAMSKATESGVPLQRILELPPKDEIARMKIQPPEGFDSFATELMSRIDQQFSQLSSQLLATAGMR